MIVVIVTAEVDHKVSGRTLVYHTAGCMEADARKSRNQQGKESEANLDFYLTSSFELGSTF